MANRYHPKGYKNPQQIKLIKAQEKERNRPKVTIMSEAEMQKAIQKGRIELLKNIPTKSDSNEVVKAKRKRYNELAIALEKVS